MALISIKIDLIAALRHKKHLKEPDPSQAAVLIDLAGVDGITCRLREDREFIRDRDIYILKEVVRSNFTVQVAPDAELIERTLEVKPNMVTLMPYLSGKDVLSDGKHYMATAEALSKADIAVGFFVKPEIDEIKAAARAHANIVELDCAEYSKNVTVNEKKTEMDNLEQMAQLALKLGMTPHCGGGLNYRNIRPLIGLDVFEGFTVGHAVLSRGLMVGLDRAVKEMAGMVHMTPAAE